MCVSESLTDGQDWTIPSEDGQKRRIRLFLTKSFLPQTLSNIVRVFQACTREPDFQRPRKSPLFLSLDNCTMVTKNLCAIRVKYFKEEAES